MSDPKYITPEDMEKIQALFPGKFVLVYVADRETKKASVRHNGKEMNEQAAGADLMARLAGEKKRR